MFEAEFTTIEEIVTPEGGVRDDITRMLRGINFVNKTMAAAELRYPGELAEFRGMFATEHPESIEIADLNLAGVMDTIASAAKTEAVLRRQQTAFERAAQGLHRQEVGYDGFLRHGGRADRNRSRGSGTITGVAVGVIPDYSVMRHVGEVTGLLVRLSNRSEYQFDNPTDARSVRTRSMRLQSVEGIAIVAIDPLTEDMPDNQPSNILTTPEVVAEWQQQQRDNYGRGGHGVVVYHGM